MELNHNETSTVFLEQKSTLAQAALNSCSPARDPAPQVLTHTATFSAFIKTLTGKRIRLKLCIEQNTSNSSRPSGAPQTAV